MNPEKALFAWVMLFDCKNSVSWDSKNLYLDL